MAEQNRHISNLCIRLVADLVRHHAGEDGVAEMIGRAGDTRRFAVLTEDAEWSSFEQFRRILVAAGQVVGVDALRHMIGVVDLTGGSMPSTTEMLQAFGSPHVLIAETSKGHNGIITVLEPDGEQTGPTEWLVWHRMRPGFEPFPELCAFLTGLQSLTPPLFGYDVVTVTEETCQCNGHDRCSFRISWIETEDATAERNALQRRVTLLERRIDIFQQTVADLVSAPDVDTALERVLVAAARAVRAPGFILAVEPMLGMPRRVHAMGVPDDAAERIAGQLLAGEACDDVSPDVAEIVSSHRHYGLLAAYDPQHMTMPDAGLLQAYARLAASVLDSAAALEDARQEAERNRALLELSSALTEITSVETRPRASPAPARPSSAPTGPSLPSPIGTATWPASSPSTASSPRSKPR